MCGDMMDNFNDMDEISRDNYFEIEDGMSDDEREKFIEDIIRSKNEYLVSKGYVIGSDGVIHAPDNKMCDGILGFAVGDALGVPVEFFSRSKLDNNPVKDMIGFGTHLVPEGSFSDDTSMVIATMVSIIETNEINYDNMMGKFYEWLEYGKYSSLDTVFDVGITTKYSILRFKNGVSPLLCGANDSKSNGNGSLMRMLPIAYYLYENNYDFEGSVDVVNHVSSLTHAHEISWLGCKIFCDYVGLILDGVNKIDAVNKLREYDYNSYYTLDSIDKYRRILSGDIVNLTRDEIKSSGYVVDTLEASLWSFINSDNYEDAVLKAINLGGDTDTIGALTGALSGIVYGRKQIPKKWLGKLRKREYLENISKKYLYSIKNDVNNKRR